MRRLPKYICGHDLDVRTMDDNETQKVAPVLAHIINDSMYDGKGNDKEIERAYFSGTGAIIALLDEAKVAAFAKMIKLPVTNTAYFSMLACAREYKGTGLFTSSLMLSLGQGLEWDSDHVACITANNRVLEKFADLNFVYDSSDSDDRKLAKKIASERFGPDAELINGFILKGTVLESYPNVPVYEYARTCHINDLFEHPFERKRCDRRLMFRRLDQEAEDDYTAWLKANNPSIFLAQ